MKFFCNNIIFIRRLIIIVLIAVIIILLILGRYNTKKIGVFSEKEAEEFVIRKGTNVEGKVVSFACKVDWGNDYISPLLDLFDKYNVKITFFPTGRWAAEFPGIVPKLSARGHEIGNSGFLNKSYETLSYENAYEDIDKADKILRELTGYDLKLFTTPSGTYNDDVIKAAIDLGYPGIILGSIDTMDWKKGTTTDMINENIFNKLTTSDIIIIHPTKRTVDSLGTIIEELLTQNYKIVPVSEMLKK
ncbi:polysaccharide deacetylase family protein [Sedimentibacter sp. MB31-C6]|uniref:polysaccharide deacetylase family protein n=1 Tax=Sedimentibacter sp. MB31-C6 TaxID=3109366 RepID=UPI002DDCE22D|nr:polysaccharide deacetylase family protein [Sedimentibacter sp. MB36-C1]WSI04257.1 polysaccharide deacetylase family protein [Sedimentibacter sp. MB36-C1]